VQRPCDRAAAAACTRLEQAAAAPASPETLSSLPSLSVQRSCLSRLTTRTPTPSSGTIACEGQPTTLRVARLLLLINASSQARE
jgi:hypothetical protein